VRVLNPLEPGMFPLLMKTGFAFFNAFYLMYLFRNWSFNKKSLVLFGGIFGKNIYNNIKSHVISINACTKLF